jgi:hypothetical protein
MPEEFTTEGAEIAEGEGEDRPTPPLLRGFSLLVNPWPYRVSKQPTGVRIEPRGVLDPLMLAVCIAPTVLGGALLWGIFAFVSSQGQPPDRLMVGIFSVAYGLGGPGATIFLFALMGSNRRFVEFDQLRGAIVTTHPEATFVQDACERIELWHGVKQGMGMEATARVLALRLVDESGPPVLLSTAAYPSPLRKAGRELSNASGVPFAEYVAREHEMST